jgi:hypothetical protein
VSERKALNRKGRKGREEKSQCAEV